MPLAARRVLCTRDSRPLFSFGGKSRLGGYEATFLRTSRLLVLMAIFFLAPFALRGARMALQSMKNDVKDWLPSDFKETAELDWFRDHFLGEQFVVVSWEGCTGRSDDESFMTLVDKLFPEVPPSIVQRRAEAAAAGTPGPADDDPFFTAG